MALKCKFCNASYTRVDALKRHHVSKHDTIPWSEDPQPNAKSSGEMFRGNTIFKCMFCEAAYTRVDNLKRHHVSKHEAIPWSEGPQPSSKSSEQVFKHNTIFKCMFCEATYTRVDALKRHHSSKHQAIPWSEQPQPHPKSSEHEFACKLCEVSYARLDNLKRHHASKHYDQDWSVQRSYNPETPDAVAGTSKRRADDVVESPTKRSRMEHPTDTYIRCEQCNIEIPRTGYSAHLRSIQHKDAGRRATADDCVTEIVNSAFKSRIISYRISCTASSITDFLASSKPRFIELVDSIVQERGAVKVHCELFGGYVKIVGATETGDTKSFNTKNVVVTESSDLGQVYDSFCETMSAKADEFQERDSGWSIEKVLYVEINISKYNPLRGSSYIALPEWIKKKQACINVHNNDNACFAWSIVSALHPIDSDVYNASRVSSYPHYQDVLNVDGLNFPMKMKDIGKFERMNDMSINVFGIEGKSVVGPLHFTERKRETHVNLLHIQDGENSHYCWIKDLSRLVSTQLSLERNSKWLCNGCLIFFRNEDQLKKHVENECNHITTKMPTATNNILEYKNVHKQLKVPFVIYADFESILKPVSTTTPNPSKSFTNNIQAHEPYSFAYYIKCSYDDSLNKFETYRGADAGKVFMQKLKREARRLGELLKTNVPMIPLTPLDKLLFYGAVECGICGGPLDNDDRVRDHDHMTGLFRSAAHSQCNIKYKIPDFIPIVLHNLSGYDSHFIVRELACDKERISVVPNNKERYISFTKYVRLSGDESDPEDFDEGDVDGNKSSIQLRFIDSLRLMCASLDKLAKNLNEDQFTEVRKSFPEPTHYKLLTQKGVFPYSYITDRSKLNDVRLPLFTDFFNNLTSSHISNKEYAHAQNVWKTFNIQTLGEYSDLYLKTGVLLLADIFENFRTVCMKTYELDPCQYLTAPSLSFDAMLKYTKVKLELLTDVDMHHFIRAGIRGGLAQCSGRHARANNKYMNDYNPSTPSTYLAYLDANNLYGWAMSQHLPISDFVWLDADGINRIQTGIYDISSDDDLGYILNVDLEYPAELHTPHNDLPFCPENTIPPRPNSKTKKLIASLRNKTNYTIHYRNLQQCFRAGLRLTAVHKVLQFTQSPWLKPYIDLNTQLRQNAKNAFEKDFYKLMNNSIFGKTMENVDKRVDVKIVNRWEQDGKKLCASTLTAQPNFHSATVLGEDLVIIQMNRVKVVYDKPIYAGFAILDLSKTLMYDFHYNMMKPLYGDQIKLLYTDTDSFIYSIKTEDFYSDLGNNLEYFDTSDYPPNNKFNLPLVNKKVLGKFKDEFSGDLVLEFIGTRAKSYCVISDKDVIKKIKGVNKMLSKIKSL